MMVFGSFIIVEERREIKTLTPDKVFKNAELYYVTLDENGNIVLGSVNNEVVVVSFISKKI